MLVQAVESIPYGFTILSKLCSFFIQSHIFMTEMSRKFSRRQRFADNDDSLNNISSQIILSLNGTARSELQVAPFKRQAMIR